MTEKKDRKVMNSRDIERSLTRIALQILEINHGTKNLAIIGIHTGGVFLADRLKKIIESREGVTLPTGTLDISLYRDDWSLATQNPMVKKTDIQFAVEGMKIVLVDDVLFTGRTIRAALDAIMDFGRPQSIQLAVLVDRGGREVPIQPDYAGMTIQVGLQEHVHVHLKETAKTDAVVVAKS